MSEQPEEEIGTREAVVTCHTDGCPNAEHAISLDIPDVTEPQVVCGPCGNTISDIQ